MQMLNEVVILKVMNWIQKVEVMIISFYGFFIFKQVIFYKRNGIGEILEINIDWCIKKILYL